MFERPKKTLQHSLFTALENAQEYLADIYFEYPHATIGAHKALLKARVPLSFQQKYLPDLSVKSVDLSPFIPYTTLRQLLRFWYTATFTPPLDETSLISSAVSGLSVSEASNTLQSEVELKVRQEIQQLEIKLGVDLLPKTALDADHDQWRVDLKRMLDEHICTDVTLNLSHHPHQTKSVQSTASIPSHRFLLASQSAYFYSAFCTEFREASTSSVHLPSDLFSPDTLQVILNYFYTDQLILPELDKSLATPANQKKHTLRILQRVYPAADFLGHTETIGRATLLKMAVICHQFKCVCSECALLLPSMLLFADKHVKWVPELRKKLITLYADPLDSLAPLWSQKPFAILIHSLQPITRTLKKPEENDGGVRAISDIFNHTADTETPSTLLNDLIERTTANMTRHNSVRALHSLHLCLSYLRSADPLPTWSQPVLTILNSFLQSNVQMIANNFDYYCVEYPILLSCVDGIGFGFSVDFLAFVLHHVLTEGIHDGNAAILYQGIVRDLGNRQEMVKNVAVDGVLMDARTKCAQFIAKRWTSIKAEDGFATIDKEILRMIADDINVPMRALTKPLDSDISTLFSFKPRKTKKEEATMKRMSFPLSESKIKHSLSGSCSDTEDNVLSILRNNNGMQRLQDDHLTDALLPIEDTKQDNPNQDPTAPRPTRLRFSLPDTPSRIRNPPQKVHHRKSRSKSPGSANNRSRWSLSGGYSTSDSSDEETYVKAAVGHKVELLRRPLPTLGTIKYIGHVDFAKGTWVGVELESRLGNNDGSVDGKRYFDTFPQRGVFVKIDDFKIISDKK
ncbi:hypothetical protein EDC96DRAFT_546697 [Choanephora cucurbitarum]|nr:hypothetical protein EDC96DRAFT_546697 [Choanephora cucurbitarum]